MTCIVLDDEPLPLRILEHYINQTDQLECKGYFTNPEIARSCLDTSDIDLLFLDIQMPDITGIEFFTGLEHKPLVVFSTAYREYAVDGFDLDAIDYLVKPYELERFQKAVDKAILYKRFLENGLENQEDHFIFVKADYKVHKIQLNDLYLVETLDDYLKLHLFSQDRPLIILSSLKKFATLLPEDQFVRIHRSYLVAISEVEKVRRKKLQVAGRSLPVGVTYQDKVSELFNYTRQGRG